MEIETQNEDSAKQENTDEKQSVRSENHEKEAVSSPRGYKTDNRKRKYNMDNFHKDRKRNKFDVGKRLSEVDIGATEFISDYAGFSGIVKDRYSDFHVHEIAKDGTVSKLTTFELPNFNDTGVTVEEKLNSLPEDIREQMKSFLENESEDARVSIDVTELDKDLRRTIHQISKTVPEVTSQTDEKDERKILVISKKRKPFFRNNRKDDRIDWSNCDGDYLYFVLHKVNMDTMDALNQLAGSLRINVSSLNYAGTKDRRAKTSQWISWRRGNPRHVENAARRMRNAYCGNFKTAREPQKLGMLKGNQFTIALRNVTIDNETIDLIMTSLRDHGFINYFGLQRFGSIASIPTHEIGKSLLQGNWKNAVDMILKPREEEQDENLAEARKIFEETQNAKKAFKWIERSDKIEAKLLRGIDICGVTNLQGALDHIPKNTLLMYIHSYQSLVWNTVVSRRIREFGKKPVVGDLVYADVGEETEEVEETTEIEKETAAEMAVKEKSLEDEEVKKEISDAEKEEKEETTKTGKVPLEVFCPHSYIVQEEKNGEEIETEEVKEEVKSEKVEEEKKTEIEDKSEVKKGGKQWEEKKLPAVKALTEEDLEKYTLADVVMPLPGYRVTYPSYGKTWYDEMIEKDGLNSDLKHLKNKKYSLSGSYRKILRRPMDLSWKVRMYDDRNTELILSDLDEMRKVELPEEKPDAKFKALIIKMSLESSTYATCALREILKQDMSSQSQAAKSAAH